MQRETEVYFGEVIGQIIDTFGGESDQLVTLKSYIRHYHYNLKNSNDPSLTPLDREHALIYANATRDFIEVFRRDVIKLHQNAQQQQVAAPKIIGEETHEDH